jgi:hypothetical protein
MLNDLITSHREQILDRARTKIRSRTSPPVTAAELEQGLPVLLDQFAQFLRGETAPPVSATNAIGGSEIHQANQLLSLQLTLPQVVQDYGDICDAITEVAVRAQLSIPFEELQMLNRCLETAVAEATALGARIPHPPPDADTHVIC